METTAISALAALYEKDLEGFDIFGIIKETGVDDEGLVEYYSKYFTYPLYRDQSFAFYQALGDRKIGVGFLFNPMSLVSLACEAWQRVKSKKIEGNLRGEGLVQGGILVFDTKGRPLAMHQEQTGQDLPVADLVRALQVVRRQNVQT